MEYHLCKELGIPLTVVLPQTVPRPKLEGIRDLFGAIVLMFDLNDTRSDGYTPGDAELASLRGDRAFYLHPYAELATMLGTANIGLEICYDLLEVSDVVGQVSGGGLFGGVCAGVKQLRPNVNMIAVEPNGANDFQQSLKSGSIVRLARPTGIADGLLSHDVGPKNWAVLSQCVSPENAVTVSDEEIWEGMRVLYDECGIMTEPSGATAFAALLKGKAQPKGKKVVVIISGGNVDRSIFQASLAAGHWTGAAH